MSDDTVMKVNGSWWEKNKQYVYYVVWAVVGLFGGNVDRVEEFLPDSFVNSNCPCVKCESEAPDDLDNDGFADVNRNYSK